MTTAAELVEDARRHLGAPEALNTLDAVDAASDTVVLQHEVDNVSPGTLLSVGLETMHVWTVDRPGRTLTVRRGHQGSAASAHAAGAMVRVAPEHTDHAVLRALNADLRALSGAGLFRAAVIDLTASASARTYDLLAGAQGVVEVRLDDGSDANHWPLVDSWSVISKASPSEFPSGVALRLDQAVAAGRTLRVTYAAPLGDLTGLAQDVEDVSGLRPSAHDIPPLGAAWRLTAGREVERNQTHRQGDSRRAEEVPPGARLRSGLGLQQVRDRRVQEELSNQWRLYPVRRG